MHPSLVLGVEHISYQRLHHLGVLVVLRGHHQRRHTVRSPRGKAGSVGKQDLDLPGIGSLPGRLEKVVKQPGPCLGDRGTFLLDHGFRPRGGIRRLRWLACGPAGNRHRSALGNLGSAGAFLFLATGDRQGEHRCA